MNRRLSPWECSNFRTATIVPTIIDYDAKVMQDGVVHELRVEALELPRCSTCGETNV